MVNVSLCFRSQGSEPHVCLGVCPHELGVGREVLMGILTLRWLWALLQSPGR